MGMKLTNMKKTKPAKIRVLAIKPEEVVQGKHRSKYVSIKCLQVARGLNNYAIILPCPLFCVSETRTLKAPENPGT